LFESTTRPEIAFEATVAVGEGAVVRVALGAAVGVAGAGVAVGCAVAVGVGVRVIVGVAVVVGVAVTVFVAVVVAVAVGVAVLVAVLVGVEVEVGVFVGVGVGVLEERLVVTKMLTVVEAPAARLPRSHCIAIPISTTPVSTKSVSPVLLMFETMVA
jgi:hypothetical protein